MRRIAIISAGLLILGSAAQASTIDLTDNTFTSVTYDGAGPINAFDELVDGVTFSFATGGQFRNVGTWSDGTTGATGPWALTFGGGGGNTTTFTLTVDAAVQLDSFVGLGQSLNTNPIFDVSGSGVSSIGNTFSMSGFLGNAPATDAFVSGPLLLAAGQAYTFTATNSGAATVGHLYGLEFTVDSTNGTAPAPAVAWLLLSGLGLGMLVRRR